MKALAARMRYDCRPGISEIFRTENFGREGRRFGGYTVWQNRPERRGRCTHC